MNNRIYYSQEAEQQAKRQQALAMILFAAFGVTIGAAVALLFAPKSGDQIRRELSSTLNEGTDTSGDTLKRLEREFSDFRDRIEERFRS
jgi:gas vesicle protein